MSELARKALAVVLAVIGLAFFIFAVATFNEVSQHSTFVALFGAPGLAAFAWVGALIFWTGDF